MEREELEKRIYDWNKKNVPPLNEGYVKTQISWSFRKPPVMPPNFDKDYYKGIGIVPDAEEIRAKNPVSYMVRKSFREGSHRKKKNTDNFKNQN